MRKMVAREGVSVMWRTRTVQDDPNLPQELGEGEPSVQSAMLATTTLQELASLLGRNAARQQRRPGIATADLALGLLAAAFVTAALRRGVRRLGGH